MFKIIEAKNDELIKEIYRFRCKVACDELKILNRNDYKNGLERDKYDDFSIQYAVLDDNDEVAACVRLVHHSDIGYPTANELKINSKDIKVEPNGELSRIFIRKDYRCIKNTRQIIDLVKLETGMRMKEMGIESSYGSLEESFFRLLRILKMPYRIIGPYQLYADRMRAPFIMYTDELIEHNRELFFETVH